MGYESFVFLCFTNLVWFSSVLVRWFIGYGWTLARIIFFVGWIYDEDGGWFESLPLDSALWIRLTASIFGATDEWRWKIIDNSAVYFSFVLRFVWFWTQELRAFSLFASSLSLFRPLKSILFIKLKQPSIFCFSFSNFQTY